MSCALRLLAVSVLLALSALVLLTAGRRYLPFDAYVVLTDSMAPSIPAGSVIVVRPVPASALRAGDVITYRRPESAASTITHRIVQIVEPGDAPVVVTQGDASPQPDPEPLRLEGTGLKMLFTVPYLGFSLAKMSAPVVRLALLALPIVIGFPLWVLGRRSTSPSPAAAQVEPEPPVSSVRRWQPAELRPLVVDAAATPREKAAPARSRKGHRRRRKRLRHPHRK